MAAIVLSEHEAYFQRLKEQLDRIYDLARQARAKGFDPSLEPESLLTHDVAERVEKAVGPVGVASRIRELSHVMQRELVALKIAEEIALGKYGGIEEGAAEQAVRTASAILDEGVTAAPIEGISSVRIRGNQDGSRYLAVYFAGPIRSAGGTDMALILVIADYVRHQLGLGKYKATELEAKRFVEELRIYEREVARFQFKVSDEELFNAIMRLPVEVNGVETDPVEVSAYRNVPRIDTNRVRGGALRVVHDGLIGRSHKVLKIVDSLGIEGWSWLREIKPPVAEAEEAREFMFMEDVLAGRPIFSFPQFTGGFRLRYGRARNTGLAAIGLHPSTMLVLGKFIAVGTQLRLEKPGKAGIAATVDSIEPPIVKLIDGSVVRLFDPMEAERLLNSIGKILFLGDILVGFGEFLENNRPLLPSGFVEEWWRELVRREAANYGGLEAFAKHVGVNGAELVDWVADSGGTVPSAEDALRIARHSKIPLHPRYTYFWENIAPQDFDQLRSKLMDKGQTDASPRRIVTRKEPLTKDVLENLCIPHNVDGESIVIEAEAPILYECLGLSSTVKPLEGGDIFQKIAQISAIQVMRKAPVYVGARMGRPEKAKRREMRPIVHCLFPVGLAGGPRRSIVEAATEHSVISVEIAYRKCGGCGNITHLNFCERCGEKTAKVFVCPKCGAEGADKACPNCRGTSRAYTERSVPLRDLLNSAERKLSLTVIPESVKGVRGLTNDAKAPEPLEKGLLRAKHDVSVFKDGTVRFDATNAPLTHFKPAEVGVEVERLQALGYNVDMNGEPLKSAEQCCALKVHDIIVTEKCGDYFVSVAKFLDELLQTFYGLPPFYQARTRQDIVGQLVIGLSPHTSVGVIGRIIGYTRASVCLAHPFWHATKRRDCFSGRETLPVYDGKEWRILPIRELVEGKLRTCNSTEYPFGEVIAEDRSLQTLALNPHTMHYDLKRVTAYSRHPAQNHVVELVTKSGRRIVTTGVHQFPIPSGQGLSKVSAHEAPRVLVPKKLQIPLKDIEYVDLLDLDDPNIMVRGCRTVLEKALLREGGLARTAAKLGTTLKALSNYVYRDSVPKWVFQKLRIQVPKNVKVAAKRDTVELPRMLPVNKDFLTLLGIYCSEGYASKRTEAYQVTLCNKKLEKHVVRIAKQLFGVNVWVGKDEQTISSRLIYELFTEYLKCGSRASEKRVPNFIFSLPKTKVKHFLRAYFEGDGSVSIASTLEVNCTSINPLLLRDLEFLLSRFGIETSWQHDRRVNRGNGVVGAFYRGKGIERIDDSFKLRMFAANAKAFCQQIGFYSQKKNGKAKRLSSPKFRSRSHLLGHAKIERVKEVTMRRNEEPFYNVTVEDHHNLVISGVTSNNCDGDEDSVSLALDILLNFSRQFLPSRIGGIMDAPLLLSAAIKPSEIARQAFNLETVPRFPLKFFDETQARTDPKALTELIETVQKKLGSDTVLGSLGFTHETHDFNSGNLESVYKKLGSMVEKMTLQLKLADSIKAVAAGEVAKRVLSTHFMRDLTGNLKAFASQRFRCTKCNAKFRRIPLKGACPRCGGKLSLTVYRGSVEKYLTVAQDLVKRYNLGKYHDQRLLLLHEEINSLFNEQEEKKKQPTLAQFV
jgi:DNA polymerase II large subunit